jgi:hypothetical protein
MHARQLTVAWSPAMTDKLRQLLSTPEASRKFVLALANTATSQVIEIPTQSGQPPVQVQVTPLRKEGTTLVKSK